MIRHVPAEHLGHFAGLLDEAGLASRYLRIGEMPTGADLSRAAALIVMGGPMSANDAEPWVELEMRIIRSAVNSGKPVLGICLGAQLLAKAFGARVYPNAVKEIGWSELHLTKAGVADPLFRGMDSPVPVFQWHGETFDIPEGAECLASTAACRHQAFRIGSSAYALQFHPEVTPDMIQEWCDEDERCGAAREIVTPIDPHAYNLQYLAATLFGRWLSLITKRS